MRIILAALLTITSLYVFAFEHNKVDIVENSKKKTVIVTKGSYLLGDNDSLTAARKILSDQLKMEASDTFGVNVDHSLLMKDSQILREKLSIYSQSNQSFEILEEAKSFVGDRMLLTLQAKSTFDKSNLLNQLDTLDKRANLNNLVEENARLKAELKHLANTYQYANEKTTEITTKIAENSKKYSDGIDLKEIAQEVKTYKSDNERYQDLLQNQVVNQIQNDLTVSLDKPEIVSVKGNKTEILLTISYEFDKNILIDTYKEFFKKHRTKQAYDNYEDQRMGRFNAKFEEAGYSKNGKAISFHDLRQEFLDSPNLTELTKYLRQTLGIIISFDSELDDIKIPLSHYFIQSKFIEHAINSKIGSMTAQSVWKGRMIGDDAPVKINYIDKYKTKITLDSSVIEDIPNIKMTFKVVKSTNYS